MTLLDPVWLTGLLAVPLIGGLLLIAMIVRTRSARRYFGDAVAAAAAYRTFRIRPLLALALLLLGVASVSVALARPAHNPVPRKVDRTGRDVVFLIDVSRSMLAQDLRPSRLERAKLAVGDVLDVVEGDRVGIVAFAGAAVIKCPLTTDYAFARSALDELSPNSVSRGGTALGDAIRAGLTLLFPEANTEPQPADTRVRSLFLITDGEDHESDPLSAAQSVAQRGVRIITLGFGSDLAGAPVPASPPSDPRQTSAPQQMQYENEPVRSKMNPDVLKAIAEATPGGVFLNVGTGNIDLDTAYKQLMRSVAVTSFGVDQTMRYSELFQFALAIGLLLFSMESIARATVR